MNSRNIRILAAIVVSLFVAGGAAAQSLSLDQILSRMEQTGKTFRSMEASIERAKVTVIVNDQYVDSGKAYFDRKGTETRIKFEFTKPEPQSLLIAQGKALLYYPKLKMAQEYELGPNQDKTEFLLVGFGPSNQDIRRLYNATLVGEETVNGKKTSVIDLQPKSKEALARFKMIRLWVDQSTWQPVQTKVTEASNDYQLVKFSNVRMNSRLPDSIFDAKLPKDVKKSNMGTIKL